MLRKHNSPAQCTRAEQLLVGSTPLGSTEDEYMKTGKETEYPVSVGKPLQLIYYLPSLVLIFRLLFGFP